MPRMLKMEIGILNIKTHPHEPQKYANLFNDLFKIEEPVKIHGTVWGVPRYINVITTDKPEEGLMGTFYKFTQINPSDPWLDLKKRETILNAEGEAIPQVDSSKKPNAKEIEFAFYPDGHLFFFNHKMMSPGYAQKMIQNLCGRQEIKRVYGTVDVEIVSSSEAIEKILKIPSLTKLNITFSRPNADVLSGRKRKLLEKMENEKVRRLNQEMISEKGEGIIPDDDTKALMDLATTNGRVFAVGYDGETRVEESTDPYPEVIRETYDPEKTTFLRALVNCSSEALSRFVARG